MKIAKKKMMHRIGQTLAAAGLLLAGLGVGCEQVRADAWTLGNDAGNIMNDGIIAWDQAQENMFFANTDDQKHLYVRKNDKDVKLTNDSCSDINVVGSSVYYVTGSEKVVRYDLEAAKTEVLFSVEAGIDEMYVSGQGDFFYLSQGDVYQADATGLAMSIENEAMEIRHFIPTASGLIYALGSARDYDLYAAGDMIAESVYSFDLVGRDLLFTKDGQDYEARISRLFGGHAADSVALCEADEVLTAAMAAVDEDLECEVCEENADAELEEDDWNLALQNYALISDEVDSEDLDASRATETTKSILNDESVSEGQRNIVRRAYQQHLIEWIPKKNVSSWKGNTTFEAGTVYSGLPYGQPTKSGVYTPWGITLETFAEAVADSGSVFYTSRASNGSSSAPYYSCDCSSFVSWAWDLPSRQYTGSIGGYATTVSNQSIYSVQIGDAFNLSGSHVCMVSDIGYQGDTMVYVDIIEQTPPITKLTRYGEGGSKSLADLNSKYLNRSGSNYVLIRSNTRDKATYTCSSAVLLEGESLGEVTFESDEIAIPSGQSLEIKYETTASGPISWTSSDTSVATVDNNGKVTAVSCGVAVMTLRIGPTKAKVSVVVIPDKVKITSATAISVGGVKLTWKEIPNADGYWVYRKEIVNGEETWTLLKTVTSAKYSDKSDMLLHNTEYTYTVCAFKKLNDKTHSGIFDEEGVTVRTSPAIPKLKSIDATSYNSQTLNWKGVDGAEGYRVYRLGPGDKEWVRIGETDQTSFLSTGLKVGSKYRYTVRAYYMAGKKAVLSWYDEDGIIRQCIPAVPALESAKAKAYNKIQLKWSAVEGADDYRVYRKTADTKWVLVDTVSSDRLTYVDTDLPTCTDYTYTVRALCKVGKKTVLSGYDAKGISQRVELATPALVSAESKEAGQITVTWDKVDGAQKYRVYRKSADTEWVRVAIVPASAKSFTDTGLTGGEKHIYTVRAYRSDNSGALSGYVEEGITGVVKLNTPKLSSAKVTGRGTVKVTWKSVAGADDYYVYRKLGDGKWKKVGSTKKTSFTNHNLAFGKTYSYTVCAVQVMEEEDKEYLSDFDTKGIQVIVKLAAPKLTAAYSDSRRTATVTWDAVESADGYNVYYREPEGKWTLAGQVNAETLTYTQKKLKSGKVYEFTVRAFWETESEQDLGYYDKTGIAVEVK